MPARQATIFHNPACSKSRQTLALIREAGIEPTIVEYLRDPPSRDALATMIRDAGLAVHEAARRKELEAAGLATGDDEALLDAMDAHPAIIERPFVVTDRGTRLCRPPERVKEIL